jgi:hypothetical protein
VHSYDAADVHAVYDGCLVVVGRHDGIAIWMTVNVPNNALSSILCAQFYATVVLACWLYSALALLGVFTGVVD